MVLSDIATFCSIPLFFRLLLYGRLIGESPKVVHFILLSIADGFSAGVSVHFSTDIFLSEPIKYPFIGSLVNDTYVDNRLWTDANMITLGIIPPQILRKEKDETKLAFSEMHERPRFLYRGCGWLSSIAGEAMAQHQDWQDFLPHFV